MRINGRLLLAAMLLAGCSDTSPAGDTGRVDSGGDDVWWGPLEDTSPDTPRVDTILGEVDALISDDRGADVGGLCLVERGFGCPCEGPEDCLEGWCVDSPDGQICTKTCLEECPQGWDCVQVDTGADPVFICLPRHLWLCRPCTASTECSEGLPPGDDRCVVFGTQGAFCGGACVADEDCPADYLCQEMDTTEGGFSKQCVPEGMACECTQKHIEAGSSTFCWNQNDFGSCEGERHCTPDGLGPCEGLVPSQELCNGADEDCDGETDEDVIPSECDIPGDFGTCPGFTDCVDGVEICVGQEAALEECNGLDDDCDGLTDEDFTDTDSDGMANCIDPDDDDDGVLDDVDCAPLDPKVFPGAVETCDTEYDDDCDGESNEEDAVGCVGYFLDDDQDGFGVGDDYCLCTGSGNVNTTIAGDCDDDDDTVYPGAEELCDGLDNNCNEAIDEVFPDSDGDGMVDCLDPDDDNDGIPDVDDCQPYNPGVPSCLNKDCGDDGCGGSCGTCPGGSECINYHCSCVPDCAGKQCGDNGCGGTCGTCPPNYVCQDNQCICLPQCGGKECGADGCGGSCGSCPPGYLCQNGWCICQPNCAGKQCGSDGCGGDCGTCAVGYTCNVHGICENQQQNPCGTVDYAGICAGNALTYCHAPGNTNSPCYTPPNCELFQMDCDLLCIYGGYWAGSCACGYQSICPPDAPYCCYCSCY